MSAFTVCVSFCTRSWSCIPVTFDSVGFLKQLKRWAGGSPDTFSWGLALTRPQLCQTNQTRGAEETQAAHLPNQVNRERKEESRHRFDHYCSDVSWKRRLWPPRGNNEVLMCWAISWIVVFHALLIWMENLLACQSADSLMLNMDAYKLSFFSICSMCPTTLSFKVCTT